MYLAANVESYFGRGFWSRWLAAVYSTWQGVPEARPTSWFRDPVTNRSVGGHPRSQHLWAGAIDFAIPYAGDHRRDPRALELAQRARREGLVPVVESDHVHIQTFPAS